MKTKPSDYRSESISVGLRVAMVKGKTSYQIAESLGVSRAMVYKLITRQRAPSLQLFWRAHTLFQELDLPVTCNAFLDVVATRRIYGQLIGD